MADLKAKQISTVSHADGTIGLIMVDTKGAVYTYHEAGWMPVNMALAPENEEKHDA